MFFHEILDIDDVGVASINSNLDGMFTNVIKLKIQCPKCSSYKYNVSLENSATWHIRVDIQLMFKFKNPKPQIRNAISSNVF